MRVAGVGSDHLEAGVVAGDGEVARVAGAGGRTQPRHRPRPRHQQQQGGGGHHGIMASCFLITGNVNATCLTCHFLASSCV